ncbi:MAG: hypothetical protein ACE5J6_02900 [Candidatus Bathyarchaeia archaeon]
MKKIEEAPNPPSPTIPAKTRYALTSAALGCLGLINVVLIGVHTTILYLRLAQLSSFFSTKAYIIGGVTIASSLTLLCGSYLVWKGRVRRGGVLNLAGGILTLVLFCYFTWVFPLLNQFEPIGYLLPTPALTSGFLALFIHGKSPNPS